MLSLPFSDPPGIYLSVYMVQVIITRGLESLVGGEMIVSIIYYESDFPSIGFIGLLRSQDIFFGWGQTETVNRREDE
jgi:hypothetical protein